MHKLVQEFSKKHLKKNVPDLRPGDTVCVYQKIIEAGKERVQSFEGIVIAVNKGKSINGAFTVRKISVGGIGVERTFLLHSPNIVKVERLKTAKVRRAKLYYLRFLSGKAARLKEKAAKKVWEEKEAQEELEKIKTEQAKEAAQKEAEKEKEEAELEKKFEQTKTHGVSQTSDSGPKGGGDSKSVSPEAGAQDSQKKS